MGASGCVGFMFSPIGMIVLDNEDGSISNDKMMEDVLNANGNDFIFEDGCVEVTADVGSVSAVASELSKLGYVVLSAEAVQIPDTYVKLADEEQIKKMSLMLEVMEDNDDVQNVWHNWDEQI
ncbi:MAG: YebC/PmpR family DNA-binding transcriptional regulator, partial [Eubacterium sp.]|jgi:transcriptional/translational regulatory protein YebC/TACO1|nr:YebC/PmpR family DNA-binding transcriptional regulator [Eubacterium sp.]